MAAEPRKISNRRRDVAKDLTKSASQATRAGGGSVSIATTKTVAHQFRIKGITNMMGMSDQKRSKEAACHKQPEPLKPYAGQNIARPETDIEPRRRRRECFEIGVGFVEISERKLRCQETLFNLSKRRRRSCQSTSLCPAAAGPMSASSVEFQRMAKRWDALRGLA